MLTYADLQFFFLLGMMVGCFLGIICTLLLVRFLPEAALADPRPADAKLFAERVDSPSNPL